MRKTGAHLSKEGKSLGQILKTLKKQSSLQLMILPGIIYIIIFIYLPMAGYVISFQDFDMTTGYFNNEWVGFKHFIALFSDEMFYQTMKNTLCMSLLKFAIAFPIPIFFALFLNEVPSLKLKKLVQTGSYLPHFLSYVVIATIFTIFFGNGGFFNEMMQKIGIIKEPIEFLAEPKWFWWLGVIIDVWKETGWHAIIYLAAIAGINYEIYEAAIVDGAGRMRRIFNITLPNIKRTVIVLFILNFGNLLSGGPNSSNFEQSYLLGNSFNKSTSYVVQYYTLHEGINLMRYSFASAAGMVLSVISLGLILIANYGTKKVTGESIF